MLLLEIKIDFIGKVYIIDFISVYYANINPFIYVDILTIFRIYGIFNEI